MKKLHYEHNMNKSECYTTNKYNMNFYIKVLG